VEANIDSKGAKQDNASGKKDHACPAEEPWK
jgi:hypothetical protein